MFKSPNDITIENVIWALDKEKRKKKLFLDILLAPKKSM
jgi:hypothetical protein